MKNKVIVFLFVGVLLTLMVLQVFSPSREISESERRRLAQFPKPTVENVFDATFMRDFDKYSVDQFPFRETFRALKARMELNVFQKMDNNGLYLVGDQIAKMEYPLDEKSVLRFAEKGTAVYDLYLQGMPVYYSIIPDKGYYLASQSGHLAMDYEKMDEILAENLNSNMTNIPLYNALMPSDYYHTDTHWKQDKLGAVLETLGASMGFTPFYDLEVDSRYAPFYGVYYGQSALNPPPDVIVTLTNDVIKSAVVDNFETRDKPNRVTTVYDETKLDGMDAYELFLSGATPLIEITAENPVTDRELIVFRDSFASSLAPLLLSGYRKITLVDLRYMPTSMVGDLVTFDKQDVLFLVSTLLVNASAVWK